MASFLRHHRRGFTLVELLVVIGIVALLMALLLPALQKARAQSQSVRCAAVLRELYVAQATYAEQNRGRFTPVAYSTPNYAWLGQLAPLLAGGSDRLRELAYCPEVPDERRDESTSSYGLNSAVNLPQWSAKRSAKMDASRIVFMAEKAVTLDDFVTTADGYYLVRPDLAGEAMWWVESLGHSGDSTFRHGSTRRADRANVVMADGHVELFNRDQYRRDSGHWHFGEHPSTTLRINFGICCP